MHRPDAAHTLGRADPARRHPAAAGGGAPVRDGGHRPRPGEATVRQSDYGIRPITVAGGMLKVKDELKLTFDIVARQVTGQGNSEAGAQSAVATRST